MKRRLFTLAISIATLLTGTTSLNAQTISDFENFSLPIDSIYNGYDYAGGFNSGNAFFPNLYLYDSTYGGYWASGFAYSSMRDSLDGSFLNMYSARPAIGAEASATYAIGQQGSQLVLTGAAAGKAIEGVYLTNGTYPANIIKYGDGFCKAFGGATGNDPDWFKVTIKAWHNGSLGSDSVEFYLADYRFSNNSLDYIVSDWQWVNLLPLGNVDSLVFKLSSTDNGMFGMNTPPFFFLDNFTTADSPAGMQVMNHPNVSVYPNPMMDEVNILLPTDFAEGTLFLTDLSGRTIATERIVGGAQHSIDFRNFEEGAYQLRIVTSSGTFYQTIIKTAR